MRVSGIFPSHEAAAMALNRLSETGVEERDVSILLSEQHGPGRTFSVETRSKAAEGVALGALTVGSLGAVAGAIASVGMVAIPALNVIAAGPLVGALTGAGAGGTAGGLVGGLIGAGIPEHQAEVTSEEITAGKVLVDVEAVEDRAEVVEQIMNATGGKHVTKH